MRYALSSGLILAFALNACAMQEGDFPSLAKRPFEDAAPAPSPEPVAPSINALPSDLQARLDAAVSTSKSAHSKFLRNLGSVRGRVGAARGAAPSSENWVVAQMALASLEMDRADSVTALADIDALYVARLSGEYGDLPGGGAEIIARSRARVEQQVDRQEREIGLLKNRLR